MIRALIFDFDGLILDTEGPIYHSWQELFRAFGGDLTLELWGKILGTADVSLDLFGELERQAGSQLERERLGSDRARREKELIAAELVRPGVRDYLQEARRLDLLVGMASSSPCQWVTGHLARLGLLDYFDTIKASDDVHRTKPDPELYRSVLGSFDLRPEQAIVFEDSPNGILAAKRAGIFCIAVPNPLTSRYPLNQADMRLESLADLPLHDLISLVETRQAEARL